MKNSKTTFANKFLVSFAVQYLIEDCKNDRDYRFWGHLSEKGNQLAEEKQQTHLTRNRELVSFAWDVLALAGVDCNDDDTPSIEKQMRLLIPEPFRVEFETLLSKTRNNDLEEKPLEELGKKIVDSVK